ncbi:MAG: SigE family RNA polymerase sigma factor [Dermatophilaceae bacterium]
MRSADARAGFEEFVTARRDALFRSAYLLTGNAADADDLVQTALLAAVPRWSRIRERPEPYLRRVMVNAHISRWRRHRGRERLGDAPPEVAAAASGVSREESLDLLAALKRLTPRQRAVIVLRYHAGCSEREIAETLQIATGTVKSTASDGIRRLRELLGDWDAEPADPQPSSR